eukprot:8041519-Alexandrium_andersonii.AAC.1
MSDMCKDASEAHRLAVELESFPFTAGTAEQFKEHSTKLTDLYKLLQPQLLMPDDEIDWETFEKDLPW